MIPYGSLVVYVTPKKRRYIRRLAPGEDWHASDGFITAEQTAQSGYGGIVRTSLGMPVRIERATLADMLMGVKRKTQIIYPKDIAWICLKLGAGPGRVIAEAGCGSGALTLALSWLCGPAGKVISHDAREEFARLARRNLDWAGLGQNVELHVKDVSEGFECEAADALFLDAREPWLYLSQALGAVKPGAPIGFLLPTANQTSALLAALEPLPFAETEVCEILMRPWKPLPDRLRPADRMAAHTGFLIFTRQQERCPEFDAWLPAGTRERKQIAAIQARQNSRDPEPAREPKA